MSSSNSQEPHFRQPLREDEFLSFDQLMERLPPGTNRESIRVLCKRGLRRHRIGKTTFFRVRDLIEASIDGDDPPATSED